VATQEIVAKKYIVKLSDEERKQLNRLIHRGKLPAHQLLNTRILLKADASESSDGRTGSQIATAWETSVGTADA
jgi:hypothetical protein